MDHALGVDESAAGNFQTCSTKTPMNEIRAQRPSSVSCPERALITRNDQTNPISDLQQTAYRDKIAQVLHLSRAASPAIIIVLFEM